MPIVMIEPVKIPTRSGREALITGINPAGTDALVGCVVLSDGEEIAVQWDLDGRAQNKEEPLNLVVSGISEEDWKDLREYTEQQLLPRIKEVLGIST
ncbi:MAG: hypothetical protein K0S85_4770 [Pseudomonas orientalis]|nr:hypothetical protein [Pseudomonas orientalis]